MTTEPTTKSNELPEKEPTPVTFKCKLCGEAKPLSEMVVSSRFFPLVMVCQECDRQ